jgi:hypothetical protein
MSNWFNVDKKGLAKLMAGRPKAFVLYELLQNAWDQRVTKVNVTLTPINGVPMTEISVEDDDPDGFSDLAHAYTLFAESDKKCDARKRGRFNIGEKLVLALAHEARVETRNGAVRFDRTGRHEVRSKRTVGSCITVNMPMTRAEHQELLNAIDRLLVPMKVVTTVNGQVIPSRTPIARFEAILPTLIAEKDGVMKSTSRKTAVRLYEPAEGEVATLYEMGIPVVETGDRFHVDVQQKVPLNMDRDNVTPGYLRAIRVAVLNATHDRITEEDAAKTWVKEACSDERVEDAAVRRTLGLRFGENAVAYDPSDPEANKRSASEGRQVIYGGNLSGREWEMAKRAGVLPAAGVVTPSAKPYDPDGKSLNVIPESQWTPSMRHFADRARLIGHEVLGNTVIVVIVREPKWGYGGTYGPSGTLVVNFMRVGHGFFDDLEKQLDFLIHEYGHQYTGDHLSDDYHRALTRLGAKMTMLALTDSEQFR